MSNKNNMDYVNYLKNKDFESNIEVNYMNYNLRVKKIYGHLYRGDIHKNIVLSTKPKFYGSLESSSEYVGTENNVIKRYTTMKQLNILDLSNTENNFINIMNFFENEFVVPDIELKTKLEKNFITLQNTKTIKTIKTTSTVETVEPNEPNENRENDLHMAEKNITKLNNIITEKKIMLFLLQLCFGIILNNDLKLYDLPHEKLEKYLLAHGIKNTDIEMSLMIKKIYEKYPDTIPSRFGVRKFDKLLAKLLKIYLKPFNIDGVMYIEQHNDNKEKLLCSRFNKLLNSESTMCPPTEICVFNPHIDLGGVKMWVIKNGKMHKIENNFKRHIKQKYKKMSMYDLYKISLLNKKSFN